MRKPLISCLSAMLLSSGAQAAAPPAGAGDPIVVTGERATEEQVQRFVKALAIPSQSDKLARFEKQVCPLSVGLKDGVNRDIEKRLRRVAVAAGLQVADPACSANVLLFVTVDRKALLDTASKSRPALFGRMPAGEIRALAANPEPDVAWQVLEVRGADGRTLDVGRDESTPSTLASVTSSRLLPQTRVDFDVAVVVIDSKAAANLTVTQLADYVAMRTFARTDPKAAAVQGAPTILTLLADKQAGRPSPLSLTEWDLAYLKALYGITNELQAGAQRGELEQLMARNLGGATRSN
jgi:hypothetical protein